MHAVERRPRRHGAHPLAGHLGRDPGRNGIRHPLDGWQPDPARRPARPPTVAAAIADLAQRQGIDPAQVVIAAWSPVTWNDGSIGCPQEGMGYTQVQVDGELLLLRVDTALFQYHARGGAPFAYCANPSANYRVSG